MAKDETFISAIGDDFEDNDYDDLNEDFCPPPSEGASDSEEDVVA